MRVGKGLKFTFLVTVLVAISIFGAIVPNLVGIYANPDGVYTSSMHSDKKIIESEIYKTAGFDNNLMRALVFNMSTSVAHPDEEVFTEDEIKSSKNIVDEYRNVKFIVKNNDTDKIYTNTDYENIEDFKNNIKGYCDVEYISKDYNEYYTKTIDSKTYNTQANRLRYKGSNTGIENFEIYMSFPKDPTINANQGWDIVDDLHSKYSNNVAMIKIIFIMSIVSLIVFIISLFIYKKIKVDIFTKDSLFMKLYNMIPLEMIIGAFLFILFLYVNLFGYYFNVDSNLFTSIPPFIAIFAMLSIIYLFNKQVKNLDRKRDIIKNSWTIKIILFIKKIGTKTVSSLKNITKNTLKQMPLARQIIFIALGLIAVILLVTFFVAIFFNGYYYETGVIALFIAFVSCIAILLLAIFIIKKLDYLVYIMEGTKKIKEGDLHHKIDIRGDDKFTELAKDINNIGQGLDNAIDKQLKSERMKSELITNVSHDLKTPLTSIINYVELIKKEENITPEHVNDYINVLDSKSKRLKALIEDLFEASKASSGNIELKMETIEINQLLRQAIGEMEEKLSSASLDIRLNMPEDKAYIYADGRRLYRVLENLLGNISKYTLNNTRVYIDLKKEEENIILTMKNISSYELNFNPDEIMERFKRADESRNTEGSGLGLAIARDLVKIQGGIFNIDIDGDLFKVSIEFRSQEKEVK
ncbi:sensor histidine kinase [Romboutsia weinsteinii]|uniref:histidine kinase n=1 Tax=Romboutsia weinsteinii TaxID=2020949 RepID=A0A371J9K0_9FIRM|nr:sensor histidine kinase [Romboutsia weinsteinii]RDY29356.1 sensor histidine kinase [Romboutsia weinsteinii]